MSEIDKSVYKGEVYRDTVKLTAAALEGGILRSADEVSSFIADTFKQLCETRGEAVPYDEYEKYN